MHGEYEFFDKVYLFLLRPTWEIIQAHVPEKKTHICINRRCVDGAGRRHILLEPFYRKKNASGVMLAKKRDFYQL